MESAGAVSIFSSSTKKFDIPIILVMEKLNLSKRLLKPSGDDLKPIELECVGHVQKHLGTRLLKLRKDKGLVRVDT